MKRRFGAKSFRCFLRLMLWIAGNRKSERGSSSSAMSDDRLSIAVTSISFRVTIEPFLDETGGGGNRAR